MYLGGVRESTQTSVYRNTCLLQYLQRIDDELLVRQNLAQVCSEIKLVPWYSALLYILYNKIHRSAVLLSECGI